MRRKDREITDQEVINKIIRNCNCCRLGFYDEDQGEVYILPLNFGLVVTSDNRIFYFHGAKEGRKIELIIKTEKVGFEMDCNYKLNIGDSACTYSARFQSVIGTGKISFVEDYSEKEKAFQAIMLQNTEKDGWKFTDAMLDSVCVFKVVVTKLSCKSHD